MRPAPRALPLIFGVLVSTHACETQRTAPFAQSARDRAVQVAATVDGAALRRHVEGIVAEHKAEEPVVSRWSTRAPYTHLKSAQYVSSTFASLGLSPQVERATISGEDYSSIYVDLPGTRPEMVLVSGHHDALHQSGADDNASAVAVLLEAARILKDTKPKRTIRIIAFDGEEKGLLASGAYVDAHRGDPIRAVVNMDCVGYASHAEGSQEAPPGLSLRDAGDFIAVIANGPAADDLSRVLGLAPAMPSPVDALGLLVSRDGWTPATGDFLRSDHAPFWIAGVPALFFTDTADFRNKNYHTANDTPDKLDYEFLRRVAAYVIGTVAAVAENE